MIKHKEEIERQEIEIEQQRLHEIEEEKQRLIDDEKKKEENQKKKRDRLERRERDLRNRILKNWKHTETRRAEKEREALRKKLAGTTKLKSAIIMRK